MANPDDNILPPDPFGDEPFDEDNLPMPWQERHDRLAREIEEMEDAEVEDVFTQDILIRWGRGEDLTALGEKIVTIPDDADDELIELIAQRQAIKALGMTFEHKLTGPTMLYVSARLADDDQVYVDEDHVPAGLDRFALRDLAQLTACSLIDLWISTMRVADTGEYERDGEEE